MSEGMLEFALLAGAALVLLNGGDEPYRWALLRVALVVVFAASAVTVWALARYWS